MPTRLSPTLHVGHGDGEGTDAPAHHWLAQTVFVDLARPVGEDEHAVAIRMYALL